MPNDRYLDEFPEAPQQARESEKTPSGGGPTKENQLSLIWVRLSHAGLGETVYRVGTAFLTIALILLAVVGMRLFYVHFQQTEISQPNAAVMAAEAATPTPTAVPAIMPEIRAGTNLTFVLGIMINRTVSVIQVRK